MTNPGQFVNVRGDADRSALAGATNGRLSFMSATPIPETPGVGTHATVVYNQLRRHLVTGELAPGTRLVEVELAERLGVSRTPVREALRRLESDGFVQRVAGTGLIVTPMGPDDIGDIGQLRVEIDGVAARLAVAERPPGIGSGCMTS